MRILGIDYGEKTIGIAISDELCKMAHPLTVIRREGENSFKKSISSLKEIIKQYNIGLIVLGFPKNMDNTFSLRCEKTVQFKERLHRNFKKMDVVLWDERLSTVGATRVLDECLVGIHKKEQIIDKIAAAFILQGYLDYIREQKN